MVTKVVEISLPGYNVKKKPEYMKLGKKVDKIIENNFPDGKYILRAIGSQDHKGKSLNDVAKIILETGTDKYDLDRDEVQHKEFCEFDHDMHAWSIEIKNGKLATKGNKISSFFGDIIYNFFENALGDRGYAVRIDLLLVYDVGKLRKAKIFRPEIKRDRERWGDCLYAFKDPENKKSALIGLVKIAD